MSESPLYRVGAVERREKPWGAEQVFAAEDDLYVGKIITLLAGRATSLQRHSRKTETIAVLTGECRVELGPHEDRLETFVLGPAGTAFIGAGAVHRISAMTDLVFAEVSTAYPGWNEDVERIADDFGRSGTTGP
jgi:mannose-6-phosphate isomerase-like protein (cupin superfamily)